MRKNVLTDWTSKWDPKGATGIFHQLYAVRLLAVYPTKALSLMSPSKQHGPCYLPVSEYLYHHTSSTSIEKSHIEVYSSPNQHLFANLYRIRSPTCRFTA